MRLYVQVPDEAILGRMTDGEVAPSVRAVYHVVNLKPKKDGWCDKGCGPLVQRKDDTPEVVSNRLKTYHEQTAQCSILPEPTEPNSGN